MANSTDKLNKHGFKEPEVIQMPSSSANNRTYQPTMYDPQPSEGRMTDQQRVSASGYFPIRIDDWENGAPSSESSKAMVEMLDFIADVDEQVRERRSVIINMMNATE